MNNTPILIENENKRLNFRLPLLICFMLYALWEMGMMYFASQTLSVDGRVLSIPIDAGIIILVAGYLLSILVMLFFPGIIVWTERITVSFALLSALALFLPLPLRTFTWMLYIHAFCCCFMIGFETALIVNLFTEKTAVLHLTVAYAFSSLGIALLQNDFIKTPFWIFRLFAVAACALQLYFFCKLPTGVWPRYVKKSDGLVCPKNFFAGVYIMAFLTTLMSCFGLAVAETVTHGVFVYALFAAACKITVFFLWKRFNIPPIRCAFVLIGIAALGFILAIVSLSVPSLALTACAMIGAGIAALGLQPLYGVMMAKRYPSRFISAGIIGLCFTAVFLHTVLLELLRNNLAVMYTIYLVIAVALTLLFFMLMPYLLYLFRGRTLQDIIGIVAKDTGDETAAPKTEQPHEQRMKTLMSHTLEPLTRREYQVADGIMRGLRRSEIAQELGIQQQTVSDYRKEIYSKFDIHSRQDLFRLAETLDKK